MFTDGSIAKWIAEAFTAIGEGVKQGWYKVTHDPLWAGVAIGVIALAAIVFMMKKKAAG